MLTVGLDLEADVKASGGWKASSGLMVRVGTK